MIPYESVREVAQWMRRWHPPETQVEAAPGVRVVVCDKTRRLVFEQDAVRRLTLREG